MKNKEHSFTQSFKLIKLVRLMDENKLTPSLLEVVLLINSYLPMREADLTRLMSHKNRAVVSALLKNLRGDVYGSNTMRQVPLIELTYDESTGNDLRSVGRYQLTKVGEVLCSDISKFLSSLYKEDKSVSFPLTPPSLVDIKYPSIELASQAAIKLGIYSKEAYSNDHLKDSKLPPNPDIHYKHRWSSFGKWKGFLGLN